MIVDHSAWMRYNVPTFKEEMQMKIQPVTIVLSNTKQLDALKYALENHIDIAGDMLTEDLPWRAPDIHRLAAMSDDDILTCLTEMRANINRRSEQLEALSVILYQVENLPVRNVE